MNILADIESAAARTSVRVAAALTRQRRSVVAVLAASLVGFGAAAFGIAPLAPDASDLPKRWVTESVAFEPLEAQLEALAGHALQLHRSEITRGSDTADSLLARLGVQEAAAAAFIRTDPTARRLLEGRPGKMVQARLDAAGMLAELVARYPAEHSDQFSTHFTRLRVAREGDGFSAWLESAALAPQVRLASGTIRTTLFAASDESAIPESVAAQMAEIFAADVDFHRELRKGDTFTVVYEALTADGEPIGWNQAAGRVVAAQFVNGGRTHSALWFKGSSDKGSYFGLDGKSKRRGFLASPMEFSRVTSGFSMRMHPILQTWRAHLGVDYAAPAGTPVRSVGDGRVEFAGWQNGYGNVVQIDHDNARTTTYAHLNRIDVKVGEEVEQGQRLGAVGATGWATGPHLHFEFRVNGQQRDPQAMAKLSDTLTLDADDKREFAQLASSVRAQLEAAETATRLGLGE